MSIAEDLAKAPIASGCKLCHILDNVDYADVLAIDSALKSTTISDATLASILSQNGYSIEKTSVRRHRKSHIK